MSEKTGKKEEKKAAIIVVKRFLDRFDNATAYEAGQELEFEEARAADVVGRGLAEFKIEVG